MDTETSRPSLAASSTQALELPPSRYPLSLAEEASIAAAVQTIVDGACEAFDSTIEWYRDDASRQGWKSAETRWGEVEQRTSTNGIRDKMEPELTSMFRVAVAMAHKKLDSDTAYQRQVGPGTRPDISVQVVCMDPTGTETAVSNGSQIKLVAGEHVVGDYQSRIRLERKRQKCKNSPWHMPFHAFD